MRPSRAATNVFTSQSAQACRLRVDQVDLEAARVWVDRVKGGQSTHQPLTGDEARMIRTYLGSRHESDHYARQGIRAAPAWGCDFAMITGLGPGAHRDARRVCVGISRSL